MVYYHTCTMVYYYGGMIVHNFTCYKNELYVHTISKYNAHTESLCKALNNTKLPDMYHLQLYK